MEKSKTRQTVKNIIIEEKGYAGKGTMGMVSDT